MAERLVALRMGGFPRRSPGSPSLFVSALCPVHQASWRKKIIIKKQNKTRLYVGFQKRQSNSQEVAAGKLLRLRPGGLCSKRDLHIWMR